MCGILAILGLSDAPDWRSTALELQKKIRHRGPDWSGICVHNNTIPDQSGPRCVSQFSYIVCHERLAIVDPESGDQPLYARDDDSLVLSVNGEIYNHLELEQTLSPEVRKTLRTKSDCEVFLKLFERDGAEFLSKNTVCGMFGFVLIDHREKFFVVARDHAGIIPLYMGRGKDGAHWVASELKCLVEHCASFEEVPPG